MVFVFYEYLVTDGWNDLSAAINNYLALINNFLAYLKTVPGMSYAFWFV